jgi:hypothetical protein
MGSVSAMTSHFAALRLQNDASKQSPRFRGLRYLHSAFWPDSIRVAPCRLRPEDSAVEDVHRHFHAKTHFGEARGRPTHDHSSKEFAVVLPSCPTWDIAAVQRLCQPGFGSQSNDSMVGIAIPQVAVAQGLYVGFPGPIKPGRTPAASVAIPAIFSR